MTGATDYLSDGERVIAVENGHPYLGQVTGVCFLLVFILISFLLTESLDWLRYRNDLRLFPYCPPLRQTSGCAVWNSDV
jgi:hypothetical protein